MAFIILGKHGVSNNQWPSNEIYGFQTVGRDQQVEQAGCCSVQRGDWIEYDNIIGIKSYRDQFLKIKWVF